MESIKIINITLDIFCSLVDLLILLCMLTVDYKRNKMNRLFILVVACNLIILLMDIGISLWNGNGMPAVYYPLQISHFITFGLGPVLLIAFTYYILTFLSKKTTIAKPVTYVAYAAIAVCAVDLLLCILNPFTHMYYFMDVANNYHRLDWFWLSQVFSFICIALNTGIIIAHSKWLKCHELTFLLSYTVLPIVALVAHMLLFGFSIINFAITFIILIFYVGIQSDQSRQLKQRELELANARVDVMLSQIQPHFLYNTLATIENMIHKDAEKAGEMLNGFSQYLRENMNSLKQRGLVPLEREIKHVNVYLDFEKIRYRNRLNIIYDLEVTNFTLPLLTIQPLAENAVRHGISKKREGGTVCIATRIVNENIEITVTDDGVGFDMSRTTDDGLLHIGLENVKSRLASQCSGTLTVESEKEKGTICIVTIPMN